MNWRSSWHCLNKVYKAAAADYKCGPSLSSGLALSRQFGDMTATEPELNRDFLVQLWMVDEEMKKFQRKSKRRAVEPNEGGMVAKQPPVSQSISGNLKPESPEEVQVMPLLARSNMLVTRDIEWANLMLGFEQENRYAIVDVCYPQSPVGFIREESNVLTRQLLRQRRPLVARVTDGLGNELFRVRRPFWWINSSIYAEINGKEVGVVHRRWHLWRRIYDLYLGNKQFAVVENPGFWNWTFTLKDIDGGVLAEIDRDWRGFGFELFTDAGQYVIRFGSSDPTTLKIGLASQVKELDVVRPLTLSERAVTLALAISLDNDYFSRHGGWGMPYFDIGE
ncbi:altered inheritance rate of mitochondria protein 25 [Argentina anserina]|uniref:altered inheritance rate of mitochondria protein 25 n=1 Tax=Argentina anserina TaxID=57926 RepID=UPI002176929D|nr:altered inheritance rate of mitochondria protein 25 [Potentilla anserina]